MAITYMSKDMLTGFDNYKYSSKDTSPLSNYVMHPFWDQVVKIVPRSIAPNVLTFSGFMLTTINTFLLTIYDYSFRANSDENPESAPIPCWVWIVCAINHFLAHTLDGIDGKQARRTNTSGPLGELFDHGLDSWACLLMPMSLYSVFGRGPNSCDPYRIFLTLWIVHLCFFLSHWEKYITGILYLPWSYDISQIVLLVFFLISGTNSHQVWKVTVPIINWKVSTTTEAVIYFCSFGMTIPVSIYNIYRAYMDGKMKQSSLIEAIRPGIPLGIFFLSTLLWATFSPEDIISRDPRMFYYMVGTVFANIASRLIISQMTQTQSDTINWMTYPVGLAVAIVFGFPGLGEKEVYVLRCLTAFVTLAHIHYGVFVVRELCAHFKINCFSIRKRAED